MIWYLIGSHKRAQHWLSHHAPFEGISSPNRQVMVFTDGTRNKLWGLHPNHEYQLVNLGDAPEAMTHALARGFKSSVNCCCHFGAAVSGEYPEFPCYACLVHDGSMMATVDDLCKRHDKVMQSLRAEAVADDMTNEEIIKDLLATSRDLQGVWP